VVLGLGLILGALPARNSLADCVSWQELRESCDNWLAPAGEGDGSLCRAYLHGYLAASEGEKPTPRGLKSAAESESYSERAVRTRINPALTQRAQPQDPLAYCIEDGSELSTIAEVVA